MAVVEATAIATAGAWVDQSAAGASSTSSNAQQAATASWASFTGWYSAAAVAAQAELINRTSIAAQEALVGMFTRYIAELVALLTDSPRITVPTIALAPVRNDADPLRVHARPAFTFRETMALTGDEFEAQRQAMQRAAQLIETDLMLASRQAQTDAMIALKVRSYRRVLRPELSKSGPCGLCVVAADRIYRTSQLMPIHGRCKCETMPIVDGIDPGINLNREDLKRIYSAAGDSTKAADLKRIRVQVNEHGELGPVLTVRGQKFTGPDDLATAKSDQVRRERLAKLNTILGDFQSRERAGENLAQPLAFQQRLIDDLTDRLSA